MIKWIKLKRAEIELKLKIYTSINTLLTEQNEIIGLAKDLYTALKDTPVNDLQNQLILAVAELAHQQATKEQASDEEE